MPACQIEEYHDTPQAREELVPWLVSSDSEHISAELWRRRLAHWWDENPFASLRPERGWLLRHEGRIVGFLGLIPACYAASGRPAPAFIASTWRVDEMHRSASLPMLMQFRRLTSSALVADTTPTPRVRELLERIGWRCETGITRRFVPLGWMASLLPGHAWPVLPPGRHVIHDPAEVQSIASGCVSPAGVEKWITPGYLRWFAASPMRRHAFIGVIDATGCLSSYLFLTHKRVRGIPAWMEIDHFTTDATRAELHALVGALVRQPSLLGCERLLSLSSFPADQAWDGTPALHQRQEQVCHCFAMPDDLKNLSKRTVLAEGDWGL